MWKMKELPLVMSTSQTYGTGSRNFSRIFKCLSSIGCSLWTLDIYLAHQIKWPIPKLRILIFTIFLSCFVICNLIGYKIRENSGFVKVSKYRKQCNKFSHTPKNQQNFALASKSGWIKKVKLFIVLNSP